MGNAKANAIYEGSLPDYYRRPNENDGQYAPAFIHEKVLLILQCLSGIERFIRDKYERKAFVSIQNVPAPTKVSIGKISMFFCFVFPLYKATDR